MEEPVGRVNHYWDRISVAGVTVLGDFREGEIVLVRGERTTFVQKVESIEHKRVRVQRAAAGSNVGIHVSQPVENGDELFRFAPALRQSQLGLTAAPGETLVGEVHHWFGRVDAATVVLCGSLACGDRIRIRGRSTNLMQRVDSMQIERVATKRADANTIVGIGVNSRVHRGDLVYRIAAANS
jgi:translation initiation factor IF-2